jgi:hypothetical protein
MEITDVVDLHTFLHILRQTNSKSRYNPIDGRVFLALRATCRKFRDFADSLALWREIYQPLLVRLNMDNTQITTNAGIRDDGTYVEGFMYFFHIYGNIINLPIIKDEYSYYNTNCEVVLTSNGTLKVIYNKATFFKTPYLTEVVLFSVSPPVLLYMTADGLLWERVLLPRSESDTPELTEALDRFNEFIEDTQIVIPNNKLTLSILVTNNISLCISMLNDGTVSLFAWLLFECPADLILKRSPPVRIGNIQIESLKNFNVTLRNGEIYINDELIVDEETIQGSVMTYVYTHTYTQDTLDRIRNFGNLGIDGNPNADL